MSDLDMSTASIPVGTVVYLDARCSCGAEAGRRSIVMEEEPRSESFFGHCGAPPFHQLRVTARYTLPNV